MATYKVPQDVEAEDKLLGPFTFRQFIYLIIVALLGAAVWGLWQVFPPLIILPLPFLVFFGALALPLRKDQPMETYLAAIVSFYLKPNKRLWDPDGIDSLIEIGAPKTVEVQRVKDITQGEAEQRLSYLAQIVDSRGWAVRGSLATQAINSSMNEDIYFDAQQTQDILDADNAIARNFEYHLEKSDAKRQEEMRIRMANIQAQAQASQATTQPQTQQPSTFNYFASATLSEPEPQLSYNPYPASMKQTVVSPVAPQPAPVATPTQPPETVSQPVSSPQPITTSENTPSPAIMNLVNNTPELSIETIAKQANRIEEEKSLSEDTIISLR